MTTIFPLLFILFISASFADISPSNTPLPPDDVCSAILNSNFCKSVLPKTGIHNIYDYCRSSFGQSLQSARKFTGLIDYYMKKDFSKSAIQALQDCKLLSELTIDFLESCSSTINLSSILRNQQIDSLQSMLSAVLTNHQTCLEGLQATTSSENGLYSAISDASKLHGVSLALFTRGWGHKTLKNFGLGRKLLFSDRDAGRDGRLPLRMSNKHRQIFESQHLLWLDKGLLE
ncbi:Plant invertase/pectin methylesterase inhibitor superfamily [Thalictrum thalictroides]|uniref:Plant invertase/pectin methylesterase inhibitor superfamily n=1 Tax=Thalictrum thalictroides TaxID=46969 RepID=A0A7J6WVK6_THATH|nr:Plant invertase/pectin methylesterase inhibitor superfamily [Thalictrum thalictroides]